MQTILGAGGVIADEAAKTLAGYTAHIRLVSRHPKKVNATDELFTADLLDAGQTDKAVAGSEIVYLTAGLPYRSAVWEAQWPLVMRHTLDACMKHGAKLVFFDNVYMYGPVSGWMTEETPFNTTSRKGKVRAQITRMLLDEVEKGRLQALVARAATFYGHSPLSLTGSTVFERFKRGKSALWMLNDQCKNTFTYIPDAGSSMVLLGNAPQAYNQSWHLPTDRNGMSGKEFIEKAAAAMGVKPRYTVLKKWMIQMAGLFNPVIKEQIELLYQNDRDYLFSSEKFEKAFPQFRMTPYEEGIRATAELYKRGGKSSGVH
jgi:nucleoside-diphosphate-sugar epimerase